MDLRSTVFGTPGAFDAGYAEERTGQARRTILGEAASREVVAAVLIGFVLVAPIVTAATIWAPVFYNLKPLVITAKLENFAGGSDWKPGPSLTALAFVSPGALPPPETGDQLVAEARRVLAGRFPVAGSQTRTLQLPFDKTAVFAGDSTWQLHYSGFRIPSILIAAYRETQDGDFLIAALDFILGWYEFEKTRWIPDGFVWNDHAIASRAMVLTEFWYFYRQSPSFDPDLAGRIVRLAAGTATLLANERLYTYATNHGTMQNLALLKLIIFFPEIKEIARYRDLAVERTLAQLPYFVSEEGIVREHSMGYHIFGVRLLHGAKIFLEHLGSRFPPEMTRRLQKAKDFVALAQRPDGTVPRIGDTLSGSDRSSADEGAGYVPRHAARTIGSGAGTAGFYPKSGYAIGWHADAATDWPAMNLAQLVAFWGHFPHRAHKHPDDLSIHLWANGIDWWTSVGYWPYPRDDHDQAISWAGSNAPHRVGEPTQSLHEPRAEYVGTLDKVLFVELTRGSNEGFRVNRQIVALPEMVWVIIDSYDDHQAGSARAVWLTDSTNEIEPVGNAGDNRYRVTASGVSDALAVTVLGSATPTTRRAYGEVDPMIGWVMSDRVAPAPAIVVDTPLPSSWTAKVAVLETDGTPRLASGAAMTDWTSAHRWSLDVPLLNDRIEIRRTPDTLDIRRRNGGMIRNIALERVTSEAQSFALDLSTFWKQKSLYADRLRTLGQYRIKMTWAVLGLGAGTLIFVLLVCNLWRPRRTGEVLCLPAACWIGFIVWLHTSYFN